MANIIQGNLTRILKDERLEVLYGKKSDLKTIKNRYSGLEHRFTDKFSAEPTDFFSSSGRIEICGNHTDHNNGKVVVAGISVDTLVAAKKTDDEVVTVSSDGYSDIVIPCNDLELREAELGSSKGMVRGVLKGLKNMGYSIGGAQLAITSNVFRGAGVSSSASFELAICEVMNVYYNGGKLDRIIKAKIGQYSENVYFGKPCGLLDQAGIALGSLSTIDFKDMQNVSYEVLDADFGDYSLVLTNTGGDHSDLTDAYASIKLEMESVAKFFGKSTLREVSESEFYESIIGLKAKVSGRAILRAIHFFEENKRVDKVVKAIKSKNLVMFFEAINESGDSSYKLLQNCYVDGDREQLIPLGLALSRKILGKRGALRVHGGGFAGTILAFVHAEDLHTYVNKMRATFGENNVHVTDVRGDGSARV